MSERRELREEKLKKRDGLGRDEHEEKSRIIVDKLLGFAEIERARNIFSYVSFRSEVDTHRLIAELMKRDKRVSVPVTRVKEKRLEAIHIESLEEDLVPGYRDILEPEEQRSKESVTEPLNIDVVIVPGSVFDERGGRFGYGGGYYDRFLENIPFAVRIGLAFELQTVKEAPLEPHDELLDYIITEERIIEAKRM